MSRLDDFWQHPFLGNSVQTWGLAAAAFLFVFTVLPLLKRLILAQRRRFAATETPYGIDLTLQLIARTSRLFLWVMAVYAAARFLDLPPKVERAATGVIVITSWLQVGLWAAIAVRFSLDRQRRRAAERRGEIPEFADLALKGSFDVVLFIARLAIFTVVLLLALDNLGVNITALVAGLGIGGIAIALAVQTVLGDLLASLAITLDKPFVVGDWLRVDDCEGNVEHIGIKSTRLRSFSGEQIIISNADLLRSRVRNMTGMTERRALFPLGVTYDTPREKLERVPALLRAIIEAQPHARFKHCVLRGFGDSSINFEVCYFVPGAPASLFLETLDAVNHGILATFEREKISFAYPTHTVVLQQAADD